ncbi:MAG: pantoate--beta-alanine ligase [Thermoguttaceae bacterium]
MTPRIIHTVSELRTAINEQRKNGRCITFVPTMGALHEGHLSLAKAARDWQYETANDTKPNCVVASLFVNPTQFGPNEDFAKYPRTLEKDVELLSTVETEIVFVPEVETMYPPNWETYVEVGSIAEPLEGKHRPGHFRGVATVVLKLFNMVTPDVAFFGQKDFQQVCVIRKMVDDLNVPVKLIICPTIREPDGLAMSSRNRYLTPKERADALVLYKSLEKAEKLIHEEHVLDTAVIRAEMRKIIETAENTVVDYISIADPKTLVELEQVTPSRSIVLLLAVKIGTTRLIDNRVV